MFALNEILKQADVLAYIRFSKIGYSQSSAISGLSIEKLDTENLLKDHSTTLIQVVKSRDKKVINVKALEPWYRPKVNRMSLLHYLKKRNMELIY